MSHDLSTLSATYQPRVNIQPRTQGDECENHYQSITSVAPYQDVSFEELRLSDYSLGAQPMMNPRFVNVVLYPHQQPASSERTTQCLRRGRNSTMHIDSPLVGIRVGSDASDQHEFSIHQDILIRNSEFFKTALKEEWSGEETEEHFIVIEMPDDDPDLFSIYADWLYSGLIYSATEVAGRSNDTEFKELTFAYILGDKLLDKPFKNAVIDAFVEKFLTELVLDLELPKLVYDNTPTNSPLRRLLVDIYAQHANLSWMTRSSAKDYLHPSFVFDLSLAQLSNLTLKTEPAAYMQSNCIYHEHEGVFQKCSRNNGGKIYYPREI